MFDRISFAIFVTYSWDNTESLYGTYETEERATEALRHAHNYVDECKAEGKPFPTYRIGRVHITELDEAPDAYEANTPKTECVCGHGKDDHHFGHPSGQSPCIAEGTESTLSDYADDCLKFRPAYNAHPTLT